MPQKFIFDNLRGNECHSKRFWPNESLCGSQFLFESAQNINRLQKNRKTFEISPPRTNIRGKSNEKHKKFISAVFQVDAKSSKPNDRRVFDGKITEKCTFDCISASEWEKTKSRGLFIANCNFCCGQGLWLGSLGVLRE